MTDEADEDGPRSYLPPGTQVRYDGLGEEHGPEYGVVVHCWLDEDLGVYECYVAFFGRHPPSGEPWGLPYVLRYAAFSLTVLGPDQVDAAREPPPPSALSLFPAGMRRYVEAEFGTARGRGLRSVEWALERHPDQPETRWRGDIIGLSLDRATNRLTVTVEADEDDRFDGEVGPEVVDYDAFKRFVMHAQA